MGASAPCHFRDSGPSLSFHVLPSEGPTLRCKHAAPFSKEMDRRPHSRCLILPRRATFEIVDRAYNILAASAVARSSLRENFAGNLTRVDPSASISIRSDLTTEGASPGIIPIMGASAPCHFRDSGPSLSFHVLPAPILARAPRGTC